jgi:ribosomal protein L7Ae-like RNA K-turn-binding protein
MKAGRLVSGDFAVEKLLRANKAKLVLIDPAASENTREKYRVLCAAKGTEFVGVADLGDWIGKPGRMLAAVTGQDFAEMIKRASAEQSDAVSE